MFFRHIFLFLSLALSTFSTIYSMSFEDLPEETQEILQAISTNNTANVEHILHQNPTIDLNAAYTHDGTPWIAKLCYEHDNDAVLKKLIQIPHGLDAKRCGHLLYKKITAPQKEREFRPKTFKLLVEQGALKQLIPQQRSDLFKSILTILAAKSKRQEIVSYIDRDLAQALTNYREILDACRKNGLDFPLKNHKYKKLLNFLAKDGNTDLVKYLILHGGLLPASEIETIIANAKFHTSDSLALKIIDNLTQLLFRSSTSAFVTNQQKALQQNMLNYLKQQWLTHKNKSVVKLLRQFALIQRYLTPLTTPEVAYKIAQYAIADFQDQKLEYLPSHEKIQEFAVQTQNTSTT